MKQPIVYILANKPYGTIYIGVTSNLINRLTQHQSATTGFTAIHNCKLLVWLEQHSTMESAITREKQLKAGPRTKKLRLIESKNPTWQDLSATLT